MLQDSRIVHANDQVIYVQKTYNTYYFYSDTQSAECSEPSSVQSDGRDREYIPASENNNFNKHNKDTTQNKIIPKGLYTWTIDRRFGDVIPAQPDTLPHLFMNTTFNTGMYGDYNTVGNNYSARQSRIFIDRSYGDYFIFTEPYSFVNKSADSFLFMNTLSPYTSILYDNCGDKTNGEDHIDAKFSVNANKRLNFGFDLDYAYARGYYSNQNLAHCFHRIAATAIRCISSSIPPTKRLLRTAV